MFFGQKFFEGGGDGKQEGKNEVHEDSCVQQEILDPSRLLQISSSSSFYVLHDPSSVPYIFLSLILPLCLYPD
jgi:hypothetical protein